LAGEEFMIGKPVALIPSSQSALIRDKGRRAVPRLHEQTLRKLTDIGGLPARKMGSRRVYAREDLDRSRTAL
jgi:hypothetical protein